MQNNSNKDLNQRRTHTIVQKNQIIDDQVMGSKNQKRQVTQQIKLSSNIDVVRQQQASVQLVKCVHSQLRKRKSQLLTERNEVLRKFLKAYDESSRELKSSFDIFYKKQEELMKSNDTKLSQIFNKYDDIILYLPRLSDESQQYRLQQQNQIPYQPFQNLVPQMIPPHTQQLHQEIIQSQFVGSQQISSNGQGQIPQNPKLNTNIQYPLSNQFQQKGLSNQRQDISQYQTHQQIQYQGVHPQKNLNSNPSLSSQINPNLIRKN